MTRRLLVLMALGCLIAAGVRVAGRAEAMPLPEVVATIADSGGHYRYGGASLAGADCSGLVSIAQTLAMGEPVQYWRTAVDNLTHLEADMEAPSLFDEFETA